MALNHFDKHMANGELFVTLYSATICGYIHTHV